jgi:hypothetical protein
VRHRLQRVILLAEVEVRLFDLQPDALVDAEPALQAAQLSKCATLEVAVHEFPVPERIFAGQRDERRLAAGVSAHALWPHPGFVR